MAISVLVIISTSSSLSLSFIHTHMHQWQCYIKLYRPFSSEIKLFFPSFLSSAPFYLHQCLSLPQVIFGDKLIILYVSLCLYIYIYNMYKVYIFIVNDLYTVYTCIFFLYSAIQIFFYSIKHIQSPHLYMCVITVSFYKPGLILCTFII